VAAELSRRLTRIFLRDDQGRRPAHGDVLFDGRAFDLSTNRYPAVLHPQGFRYLKEFRLDPFPVFTYEIEGIEIEKTVFMVYGENSTIIQYQLGNVGGSKSLPGKIALELRDLATISSH
jgi:Glycogen debranching enzyme N terminal